MMPVTESFQNMKYMEVDYLAFLLSAMNRRDAIDPPFFLIIILFIYLISF